MRLLVAPIPSEQRVQGCSTIEQGIEIDLAGVDKSSGSCQALMNVAAAGFNVPAQPHLK